MVGDDRSVARQLREVRAKMRRNGRYARTLTLKAISQKDDRYPESGENWIGRGGRYSSFYRSTLKVFPRLNSSLDPCPELCRCRRCKTQLFKRAGAAKSVARCSVERTLANPGSLMELVGKEGEKMERRKGICFFFPRWHTRIDRGIDRSIDRSIVMHHGSRKLRYKFPLSSRTPPLHSADRMLHFVPDSRLTLQLFRKRD